MAKVRTELDNPARWLGGGAVALLHLVFLLVLLMTDRLTLHKTPDVRPMTVYRIPDTPKAAPPSLSLGTPSRAPSLPSVLAPRLDGPMILVQPEKPALPGFQGLDLSVKPGTKSLDDLMPSKEKRLKQFFKDQADESSLAKELPAGEDCVASFAKDRQDASLGDSAFKDPLPIELICSPRGAAKALAKRNQRFAPQ